MDVHRETVVVCVLPPDGQEGKPVKKVYGTFHADLGRMRGWLKQLKVTSIAMESTGVYWRPVWNVLEGHGFELLLANPKQVKALHGRKSDKRDGERIAQFLQDRRLDPSFVPPPEIQRLRDLLRYRLYLLEQRNETHNKIRDLFETANIKLSSVASDLLGVTGHNIIEAMIAGEASAERLSWKVNGTLRKKEKEVKRSLAGCFDEFHRGMLEWLWKQYSFLSAQIAEVETCTRRLMEPHRELVELLDQVPGVNETVAWTVIAELGIDMGVFPTAAHVASWAGCVRAPTKARANRRAARRGRATAIYAGSCYKRPGRRRGRRIAICGRSFTACSTGGAGGRRLLPWGTSCCGSSTRLSRRGLPITSLGPITTIS